MMTAGMKDKVNENGVMSVPLGTDVDYTPVCKFCGEKVDEMVMVHFKYGSQRMCVACMNDKRHRTLPGQTL